MKTIYMRDVLKDLWKKKILVFICLLIFIGVATITGYKKSNFYDRISTKDKIKVEKYYEKLEEYEASVEKTEKNIIMLNEIIDGFQSYIDNSILMHLNPDNIYVAEIKFSSIYPINESVFLDDKYLNEVLVLAKKENNYSINIMLPTEEQALGVINFIVEKIKSKYEVANIKTTCYVKADTVIINTQKNNISNLVDYIDKRANLEENLNKQKKYLKKYIAEKPEVLKKKEQRPLFVILKYMLFSFSSCIVSLISVFTIKRIL